MNQDRQLTGITKQLLKKFNSSTPLGILLVDEVGGGSSLQLANDIAATGASVYLLHQFSFKIRLSKSVILLPPASLSPTELLGSVDRAVKSHCPDIVLPTSEEALHRFWDEAPDWLPLVHPVVEPDLRVYYRNRHLLASLMSDSGVLIPETHQLETGTAEEILSIIDKLNLPVVVKGARGEGESKSGSSRLLRMPSRQCSTFSPQRVPILRSRSTSRGPLTRWAGCSSMAVRSVC